MHTLFRKQNYRNIRLEDHTEDETVGTGVRRCLDFGQRQEDRDFEPVAQLKAAYLRALKYVEHRTKLI